MLGTVLLTLGALVQAPAPPHLIIVTGLGGEPVYRRQLAEWAATLAAAARQHGVPAANIITLTGDSTPGHPRSTRANVLHALEGLAGSTHPGEVILLFLAGHGSGEGADSRLNIPGPDLSAGDLAVALEPLRDRRVVVVNAASASGDMIPVLSRPGRVVITATRSPYERNATRFGGYFVAAVADSGADVDKDGRVSMLEAFLFARRETARSYEAEHRLLTEHAVLDDNGDSTGSAAPGADSGDGVVARTIALAPPASVTALTDSASRALAARRRQLEQQIAALRARKASLREEEYEAQLEDLLVQLAITNEALRARERGQ